MLELSEVRVIGIIMYFVREPMQAMRKSMRPSLLLPSVFDSADALRFRQCLVIRKINVGEI